MGAKPFRCIWMIVLGSFAISAGCVSQSELSKMQARLNHQEQQIQQFSMQLSGVQPAQADTWAQVQQLRQEMGAVKGQIDDFNNASASIGGLPGVVTRMERQQQALRTIETRFAMDLQLDDPMAATDPMGAAGMQMPDSTSATGNTVGGAPVTVAPNPATSAPAAASVQQPKPTKDMATALYDAGIASFNARKYKEALNSFTDFTKTYPKHKLVSNAWFWQGESQFALGSFPAAALAYEKVISAYSSSSKAPAAYLKQGMSFIKTGNKDAARVRLQELVKKYPKTPEAARANQVLKEQK